MVRNVPDLLEKASVISIVGKIKFSLGCLSTLCNVPCFLIPLLLKEVAGNF